MSDIYLLLGTNLGDREKNLQIAKEQLTAHQLTIKKESSIYETAAWGVENQPSFLNQVVTVDSDKNPERVLIIINIIEGLMGRIRNLKWAQRLIDIDILYYGNSVIDKPKLKVPHAEIQNRRFTLTPLVELAPNFKHPISGKTQLEMLEECQDKLKADIFQAEF